jgi:hypothetical protein
MANFLIIIGVVFAVLNAMMKGYLTVEIGSVIIIAIVFLIAVGRSIIVKLAATSIPIYFFAKEYGLKQADFISMLPLFIALSGYYIMFRGLFKK